MFERIRIEGSDYIQHPYIVDEMVEARDYQVKMATESVKDNTLVALPTGTGKTIVAILLIAERLNQNFGKRALMLAPTKPLVEQHAEELRRILDIPSHEVKMYTGDTRPEKRGDEWEKAASVVVATPQCIENDLISGRISLDEVVHLVFDECHRATSDYPYSFIAEKYTQQSNNELITGLSASPGSDRESILRVCNNLFLRNIEVLTEDDEILAKYLHETTVEPIFIDIDDEILEVRDRLQTVYKEILKKLKKDGYLNSARKDLSIGKLKQARGEIQKDMQSGESGAYKAISLVSEAMKLNKAMEIIETQGVEPFRSYFDRQETEASRSNSSKAVERLLSRTDIKEARRLADEITEQHPKQRRLRTHIAESVGINNEQVIVFAESRDTVSLLVDSINEMHDDISAHRFVGQTDKEDDPGMSQSQQQQVIQDFRDGKYDVLVATSIAEEGLDIPQVDLVIFYEPVPSGVRSIQRRGRTGRQDEGKVYVYVGRDTRDEGYYYAAKNREGTMEEDIKALKELEDEIMRDLVEDWDEETDETENKETDDETEKPSQRKLGTFSSESDSEDSETQTIEKPSFDSEDLVVVADKRETSSTVPRKLSKDSDVDLEMEQLDVGDYVVSDRVVVERKSMDDFVSTLTGERSLFEQISNMSNNYYHAIVLLEGDIGELYESNVHPNAIRGTLSSIAIDFNNVKILVARNEDETASFLRTLASREQEDDGREIQLHEKKQTRTLREQQEYIVSSIENIGTVKARKLLEEFGSVHSVFTADKEQLSKAENIGESTAEQIYEILRSDYADDAE